MNSRKLDLTLTPDRRKGTKVILQDANGMCFTMNSIHVFVQSNMVTHIPGHHLNTLILDY